jgi:hypothetical protein
MGVGLPHPDSPSSQCMPTTTPTPTTRWTIEEYRSAGSQHRGEGSRRYCQSQRRGYAPPHVHRGAPLHVVDIHRGSIGDGYRRMARVVLRVAVRFPLKAIASAGGSTCSTQHGTIAQVGHWTQMQALTGRTPLPPTSKHPAAARGPWQCAWRPGGNTTQAGQHTAGRGEAGHTHLRSPPPLPGCWPTA